MLKTKVKEGESPLQPIWNGVAKEYYQYRNSTLGQLLTLIDSVIVNEKQNKSIKDIIRNIIWEDKGTEVNIAHWFCWIEDNFNLERRSDQGSSEPMQYEVPPFGDFREYKKVN